jgi:CarD family transcriptional regulator
MFCLHEKVVYPGHGVAKINRIIKKSAGGCEASFYELIFLNKDMTVLVPTDNADAVGLRPLSSHENIQDVFVMLTQPARRVPHLEFTPANWSKRNKEYQIKLKSGNLRELSEIYRDLHSIAVNKELSFGEKNLLTQIETLLVEEISLVQDIGQEKTIEHLRSLCSSHSQKKSSHQNTLF